MFVYYTAGVLCTVFLPYFDLFLHTLARCSGYCCNWSHSMTNTHSVGLLWTSDQPVAVTSTWRHTTLTRDRPTWPRRHSNPQFQQARGRTTTL